MENQALAIIDCHQHFIDSRRLRYPVFMQRSAGFEALVGDYSALARVYLPEDYARDVNGLGVVKTVWAEFISDDPMGEVTWAQELAHTTGRPQGMIGLVDFSSPEIEHTLDLYTSIEPVRAVPLSAKSGCEQLRQGSPYSITSSASAKSFGENWIPSALAVF